MYWLGYIYRRRHDSVKICLIPAYAAYPLFFRAVTGMGYEVLLYPRLHLCVGLISIYHSPLEEVKYRQCSQTHID